MGERQRRLIEVLHDNPAGLVVDELLRRACPAVPRRLALCALGRLVDAGLVSLEGKRSLREIASAMVRLTALATIQQQSTRIISATGPRRVDA